MSGKRKVHRINITVDVEMQARTALPTRRAIADGLVESLKGARVDVATAKNPMFIIGTYSSLATGVDAQKAPDLDDVRQNTVTD